MRSISSSGGSSSGSALKECDVVFNPANKFCYDGIIYDKCDGMEYNPTTHICQGTIATPTKCNGVQYNPLREDCCVSAIFNKLESGCCVSAVFNLANQRCQNSIVETKCGDDGYNPATQFCSRNIIYNNCGGSSYNPVTQFCSNGTLKNYGTPLTDARDGKTYNTIEIGTQTWMAENINYNVKGSKCYDNKDANCVAYGRLYDLATAETVCPDGWHLSTVTEWTTLMNFVGGLGIAGAKLKTASGWSTGSGYKAGTDDFGFTALPGGGGYAKDGDFSGDIGSRGYWWSDARRWDVSYNKDAFDWWTGDSKDNLYSVRCVKD
jgi:uncharacterized protein (TIGR02145 family)